MKEVTIHIDYQMSEKDQQAIRNAVDTERKRLLEFIRKRVPSDDDAKDILQDVFYDLLEAYQAMKPIEKVASWLFKVARNKITDLYRKKKPESLQKITEHRALEDEEGFTLSELWMDLTANTDNLLIRNMVFEAFEHALNELPENQKEVFILHELEDVSFDEISKRTGVSINTLLSRKRYAVLHLRNQLKTVYQEFILN